MEKDTGFLVVDRVLGACRLGVKETGMDWVGMEWTYLLDFMVIDLVLALYHTRCARSRLFGRLIALEDLE